MTTEEKLARSWELRIDASKTSAAGHQLIASGHRVLANGVGAGHQRIAEGHELLAKANDLHVEAEKLSSEVTMATHRMAADAVKTLKGSSAS